MKEMILDAMRHLQDEVFASGAKVICEVSTHRIELGDDEADWSLDMTVTSFTDDRSVAKQLHFGYAPWNPYEEDDWVKFRKSIKALLKKEKSRRC